MVHLTCGDKTSLLEAAEEAAQIAVKQLGDAEPVMAFFFSCMARKTLLGQQTKEEFIRVRQKLGEKIPIIGFYSYGEYCSFKTGGPCMLHNESANISLIGI